MINKKLAVAALAAVASTVALMGGAQAQARDQIRIVGSSTVFPFTTAVAEQFGREGRLQDPGRRVHRHRRRHQAVLRRRRRRTSRTSPTPRAGSRSRSSKPAPSQRRHGRSSRSRSASTASSSPTPSSTAHTAYTIKQLWLALAKQVAGRRQARRQSLQDLERHRPVAAEQEDRSSRPAADLRHPRRLRRAGDGAGCAQFPEVKALPSRRQAKAVCKSDPRGWRLCRSRRERQPDRPEARRQPGRLGIFGYSFLDQNLDKLQGARSTASRRPSRPSPAPSTRSHAPLYIYVKNAACRRHPGHQGIPRRIHQRRGVRRGRLSGGQGPDPAAEGGDARRSGRPEA